MHAPGQLFGNALFNNSSISFFVPYLIAYGKASGTGSLTGAYPSRFVSQAKYAKYADLSYLSHAIDDPKSRSAVSDLVVA